MISTIPLAAVLFTSAFLTQDGSQILALSSYHETSSAYMHQTNLTSHRRSHKSRLTHKSHKSHGTRKTSPKAAYLPIERSSVGQAYSTNKTTSKSGYQLSLESSGSKFFDDWDFFTDADPTHGMVNYQAADQAWKEALVSVGPSSYGKKLTTAKMRVDNSTWLNDGEHRKSVRLSSKKSFKYGLLVLDAIKMPFGCSTWPAFWTVGDNWPKGGEIDIVEGVNMLTTNQMTLHTASGCNVQNPMGAQALGRVIDTNCDAYASANTGCGVADPSDASFGAPFNANGGGIFVMEWKASGISIWRFNRTQIPEDLNSESPQPSNWSHRPLAHWSNNDCSNLSEEFAEHRIIFDITLCGDWAGSAGVYNANGACGGTCASAIKDPRNFHDAHWEIASVKLYQ